MRLSCDSSPRHKFMTSTTSASTRCAVACHKASCEQSEVKERELIRAAFIRDLQTCGSRQPEDSPFRHVFEGMNHSRVSFSTKPALSRAWDIRQLWERRTGQSFQSVSVRSSDCWPVLGGVEMFSFLLNQVRVYVKCDVPFWCDAFWEPWFKIWRDRGSVALPPEKWSHEWRMSPRTVAWATGVLVGILGCVWNVLPSTLSGGCNYKKAYHYLFKKL